MSPVDVAPAVLDWAVRRGDVSPTDVRKKHPHFDDWRTGRAHPTLPQLESFAQTTNTPFGYLLLSQPPDEPIPVADFRVRGRGDSPRKSGNLLDQLFLCERRQDWYRDYAAEMGFEDIALVGSLTPRMPVEDAATQIRRDLKIEAGFASRLRTQGDMVSALAQRIEDLGLLVMISGVVGTNNYRVLDVEEFSGFALADARAPLVFVNGSDTKRAQAFTLIHELAHIYIGDSALSQADPGDLETRDHEDWCNGVAARTLVPADELLAQTPRAASTVDDLDRLATHFKVSTLVILRRMYEARVLSRDAFFPAYEREVDRLRQLPHADGPSGGSFYYTAPVRASKRFTRAILQSTLEGNTLYRDAFAMLGTRKSATLHALAEHLGVA